MSRVRFQQIEHIGMLSNVRLHISGPGWEDWNNGILKVENVKALKMNDGQDPHLVLTYKVQGLASSPYPVVMQYNEAFDISGVFNEVIDNNARLVILHHENDWENFKFLNDFGIKTEYIHHCADMRVYRDYGLRKSIDILVYGAMSLSFYPFRIRLKNLAIKYFAKHGYKVKVLKHPGYTLPNPERTYIQEELAKLINRAKLTICASSTWKYEFAKYSEIGCCRSLALGDNPCIYIKWKGRRKEFFDQTILNVEPWMMDREIINIAESVLDDPDELKRKTNLSYEMNMKESRMERYAEAFESSVKKILEGNNGKSE